MNKHDDKSSGSINRKGFVASTAAAAGALSVSNIVSGAENDTEIKIALIGCGGRGTGAAKQAMNVRKGIKIVAVADAFADKCEKTIKALKLDVPSSMVFSGFDAYKQAIDQSGCDLVILTTPPGFRPIHFEYAVNAGKMVFMEKPVAVDAPGIRKVLATAELAKKKKLAVAVGLQRHHEEAYHDIIDRLRDGAIGNIDEARVFWNSGGVWTRPRTADQSEMEYQMRNWYYFNWLCGDHINEQHIHNLDVINWMKNAYPVSAEGMGGRQARIGKDWGEIYDHHFVEYTYADGSRMYSQCRHIKNTVKRVAEFVYGDKGTCDISRGIIRGSKNYMSRGKRGGHQQEWFNLIAAIDKGEVPNEAEYGAKSTMTAIMGRMATYSGKTIKWDEAINSSIDLSPAKYSWDADPGPKMASNGLYPSPIPGVTKTV
jgi:predicted dehydrogenase